MAEDVDTEEPKDYEARHEGGYSDTTAPSMNATQLTEGVLLRCMALPVLSAASISVSSMVLEVPVIPRSIIASLCLLVDCLIH